MKKILICVAAMCTALLSSTALAAGLNEPDINYQTNTVIISGTAGAEYAGNMVSLQILNPGKSFSDIMTDPYVLNWSDQGVINPDGSFSFTVNMKGSTGNYDYFVGVADMAQTLFGVNPIKYFDETETNIVWGRIQTAIENQSASDILWVIENRSELLQIDPTEFNALSTNPANNEKGNVLSGILESEINNIADFKTAFGNCMAIHNLYLPANAASFSASAQVFLNDAENDVKTLFGLLENEEKTAIIDKLKSTAIYSKEKLLDVYTEEVLRTTVNKIKLNAEMDSFIINYAPIDTAVLNRYTALADRMAVAENMRGKLPIADMSMFGTELIGLIGNQETIESIPSRNPSYGGGGGGGGVSFGVANPPKDNVPNINENMPDDKPANTHEFYDLDTSHWAYENIMMLVKKGIINGDGNGKVRPEDNITRAEFLQMLVKAFGLTVKGDAVIFSDVKDNDWFKEAIEIGYTNGIASGSPDGRFNPNMDITRQDMMTMLYNCAVTLNVKIVEGKAEFADKELIAEYAKTAVNAMTGMRIVSGYEDNTIRPLNQATRAEAATVICKMMDYVSGGIR